MSYFREVLYLQTKNEGIGVGYIKRDQKGNKRRERIVFTGFLQSGVGEYKGEIHYVQEEAVHFLGVARWRLTVWGKVIRCHRLCRLR